MANFAGRLRREDKNGKSGSRDDNRGQDRIPSRGGARGVQAGINTAGKGWVESVAPGAAFDAAVLLDA